MILYNLRHAGDQYRITKLTNGEVASSYLCTPTECQCPRGEYPTCRHRQMLPTMLNQGLCDSEWFLDWDGGHGVMDLHGHPRMVPPTAAPLGLTPELTGLQEEMILMGFHQPELCKPTQPAAPPTPFRRRL